MVVNTLGWISVGPGPISVLCGGWNELIRLAGAKSSMASFPERGDPKRTSSGRDLTFTGFLAEASLSTATAWIPPRSEERRVGKECRSRWWRYYYKKKEMREEERWK